MRTADYDKIGLLPLRHHGDQTNLWTRSVLYAATVEERDKNTGRYELERDSVGDVNCALKFGKTSRDIVGWAFCWPVVTGSPASANTGASAGGSSAGVFTQPGGSVPPGLVGGVQFVTGAITPSTNPNAPPTVTIVPNPRYAYTPPSFDVRPVFGGSRYPVDSAFASIHMAGKDLPKSWPGFPKGYYGIGVAGTEHKKMLPVVLSGDPRLIAVNYAGFPGHSSIVVDTDGSGRIDDRRNAPIHSVWRVILEPEGALFFGPRNPIAWNFAGGGQDGTAGYGLLYDGLDSLGLKPMSRSALDGGAAAKTQQNAGPVKMGLAAAAHRYAYGPLHLGGEKDKHIFGKTKDGESIASGHIHTDAYFCAYGNSDDQDFDAPLEFQLRKYPGPGPFPMISRVHLAMDHGKTHPWVQGQKAGLWRWWAEFAMGTPPTTRPPPPTTGPPPIPPPPPPPTTPSTPTTPPTTSPPNQPLTPGMPGYSAPTDGGGGGGTVAPSSPGPTMLASFAGGAGIAALMARGRDSWFPGKEPAYRDYGKGTVDEPPRYTLARTRENHNPAQPHLRVYSETSYPALLFQPQELHPRAADLRRSPRAPSSTLAQADEAPVVGRMEAWGAWKAGDWVTSGLANRTKYRRIGAGGVLLTPPQVDLSDSGSTYAPAGITRTAFYFALAPGAYFGAGLPDLLTGGLKTGYRWGHDGAGLMKIEHLSSAGVATEVLGFNASKQLRILEGGGTLLTFSGTLADGEYLMRSGTTLVGGSGGGSGAADDASTILAHQSFGVR